MKLVKRNSIGSAVTRRSQHARLAIAGSCCDCLTIDVGVRSRCNDQECICVRIGFDQYTIEHRELSPEDTLAFARERNLEGVQFLDPSAIDRALNHERLGAFRKKADALGLYVEVGIPSPNPVRRARSEGRPVDRTEHVRHLLRRIEAVAALGCGHARAYIGDRHDRFRTDTRWDVQLVETREVLKLMAPALRALGIRIAIETHADVTVTELLRLIDELGTDVAGVTLDTGNLLMRLDDPMRAVERLAPLVLSTHVKDAVLALTPRGLCWQARPVGSGILPMTDIIATLHSAKPELALSIELHPRTYDLPVNDPSWLAFFPELTADSLATVRRIAEECERRYAEGILPRPSDVESIPWSERDLDWLARSAGYLRPIVKLLDGL
jgi:sugar phosphate isomerase/epimerase